MFPGCTDVVRVETKRWTPYHGEILDALLEKVRRFLRGRSQIPFEQLRTEFQENDTRVPVGDDQFAHIMYGKEPLFVRDGQLQTDVRGLVVLAPSSHV